MRTIAEMSAQLTYLKCLLVEVQSGALDHELKVPREEVIQGLTERIEEGDELLKRFIAHAQRLN